MTDSEQRGVETALHASSGTLRLVTWNCHGAVGADKRCDPERTLATIARLAPDVLALQEVDGRSYFGRRKRAFEFYTERLGPFVAEARTVGQGDTAYGHLLWSRWPILSKTVHVLPGPGIERRAAIEALIAAPNGPIRVIAFHLGLVPWTRARQAAAIAALMTASAEPVAAMGDSNDWRLAGSVHRKLGAVALDAVTEPTWPARRPFVRMDRIYLAGATLRGAHIDAGSADASDHRALVADIALPAGRDEGA